MNEETLEWLETQRRLQNGSVENWRIEILTDGFYVKIIGGEETYSDPPSYLEHIKDFKTVSVELYRRGEPLSKEKEWDPITVAGHTFNFNTIYFPHKGLFPPHEDFMKDEPWAEKFKWHSDTFAPSALLSLDELDIVMKYLVKLDALAAFR